ncbi:hypothetical protein HOF17_04715 [Candidatus Peribacteria bacterium]|nr:hypothetical protein [Candidatus Peribacteria bacterium]
MLEYIKEYNEKYQQRKKDLLTPYKEEDKPSEFSYDTEKLIDYSDGYKFTFGKYGYVYDFDAFIYIPSMDLNDKEIGKSAEFSKDVLPDFLSLDLSKKLSEDKENLTLLYTLKNEGLNSMDDMQFIFFIDPETVFGDIEETKNSNNRTDEYGEMLGELGNGFVDSDPDYWEIDEPGYVFGNIIDNAKLGMLDNQNNVSEELHDDPSYAIGFDIKPFSSGQKIEVEILLSTKNDVVGSLQLVHKDKRLSDVLSISGQVELLEASIEE